MTARSCLIMGVLNVTPDSFSDGGAFIDPGAALARAEELAAEGADVIDVGAESTRPGAKAVGEAEEWERLVPVLTRLARASLKAALSIDTRKPNLMLRAADLGVTFINDVGGSGVPAATLSKLAKVQGLSFIAMHMHGEPETMQRQPLKADAAKVAVTAFFAAAHERLLNSGFAPERIWLDPGIGFGKSDAANVALMREVGSWTKRYQVAVGISRKGFIGRNLGIDEPKERDAPSKMLELGLAMLGARMIRTHAVKPLRQLLDLLDKGD